MKRCSYIILAVIFLIPAFLSHAGAEPENWYRFILSPKLDENSPANAGKNLLDAPAGKHGFIKTEGQNFFFEDGTPARFWGTTLGSTVSFPSKKEADSIASQLAFLGFNSVRFHHLDMEDEPGGIFKPKSSEFSPEQMDRLDYLVHKLEQKGIYINFDLLTMRRFRKEDGVVDADKVLQGGKPVAVFDPKLIQLQKEYAKEFLTHKNPYTGLRYCDDPAVVFIEVNNETSIFQYWGWGNLNGYLLGIRKGSIAPYYVEQLDRLWNEWLAEKYKTLDEAKKVWDGIPFLPLEKEGFFFKRPMKETLGLLKPAQVSDIESFYVEIEKRYFDDMVQYLKKELGVRAAITGMSGYFHHNDLKALGQSDFTDTHTYFDHPKFPGTWSKTNFKMRLESIFKKGLDKFLEGVKNSRLKDKPLTVSEWNHCYPNKFAYETPILIANSALQNNWPALYQFAWSRGSKFEPHPGDIQSFFHMAQNAQQKLLCLAASAVFYGSDKPQEKLGKDMYEVHSKKASAFVGFLKNKELGSEFFSIRSNEDGAVALFSPENTGLSDSNKLILMTVGEIRNHDSRWNKDKFFWGGPWSELKKMTVEVEIKTSRAFKVYSLGEDGKRGAELTTNFKDGVLKFSTGPVNSPWFELSAQ